MQQISWKQLMAPLELLMFKNYESIEKNAEKNCKKIGNNSGCWCVYSTYCQRTLFGLKSDPYFPVKIQKVGILLFQFYSVIVFDSPSHWSGVVPKGRPQQIQNIGKNLTHLLKV